MIIVDMIVTYFIRELNFGMDSGMKNCTKTSMQNTVNALVNDFRLTIDDIFKKSPLVKLASLHGD